MGDHQGDGLAGDGETPVHPVTLDAFEIDAVAVTNARWAEFAGDTGYRTESETFGFSYVFRAAVRAPEDARLGSVPDAPWWIGVAGASWRHPGGALSDLDGLDEHPVVHVSWNDAVAYARWAGRALPTEAQWEAACRGGLEGRRYPWGDDLDPDGYGRWRLNIWQGEFPEHNSLDDGWDTTAPVTAFPANDFGLHATVGNVWEWCADRWSPDYYRSSPVHEPPGPRFGSERVIRGGSYLCHDSYCNRYRNAARSHNTPDSATGHMGFRTIWRP